MLCEEIGPYRNEKSMLLLQLYKEKRPWVIDLAHTLCEIRNKYCQGSASPIDAALAYAARLDFPAACDHFTTRDEAFLQELSAIRYADRPR
jgi:hypothetical protein